MSLTYLPVPDQDPQIWRSMDRGLIMIMITNRDACITNRDDAFIIMTTPDLGVPLDQTLAGTVSAYTHIAHSIRLCTPIPGQGPLRSGDPWIGV